MPVTTRSLLNSYSKIESEREKPQGLTMSLLHEWTKVPLPHHLFLTENVFALLYLFPMELWILNRPFVWYPEIYPT